MNRDDVIPPSPPVKLGKSRLSIRNSKSSHQKKKPRREILSERAKNLQQQKSILSIKSTDKIDGGQCEKSSEDSVTDVKIHNVNIYIGLDDVSPEEKNRTMSMLNDFDILHHTKLIEECNKFDLLSHSQNFNVSQTLSQTHGLVSVKDLLLSSQNVSSVESNDELSAHISSPSLLGSLVDREARDVSLENIQFSEWQNQSKGDTSMNEQANCSNQSPVNERTIRSFNEYSTSQYERIETIQSDMEAMTFVESILDDFNDDESEEEIARTPPVVLLRRPNRKTYDRIHVARVKVLTFDDDDNNKEGPTNDDLPNEFDVESTQYTQDIDVVLNDSRRILENLTQLNTYFTQPQSYQLDFSTDLSHNTVTLDEEFKEFAYDSDDFVSVAEHNDFEKIVDTPNNSKRSTGNNRRLENTIASNRLFEDCDEVADTTNDVNYHNPSIQLLDDDGDDIFVNINTPKIVNRCRAQNQQSVSTPFSLIKGRIGDTMHMHSTPSTSKQSISIEQRIPKRLHFGAEFGRPERNPENLFKNSSSVNGFVTARGTSIEMTAAQMKRTASIFADIDEKYNQIDPVLEEKPIAKKFKHSSETESFQNSTSHQGNMKSMNSRCEGFRTMGSSKLVPKSIAKTMTFFGEDFDFGKLKTDRCFKSSSNVAGTSFAGGFSTAGGSNIQISTKKMEKYAQTLKEIDRNLRNEFKDDANLNENILACQTPLRKNNHSSTAFITSTPNPSSLIGIKGGLPITPNFTNDTTHCPLITPIVNNKAKDFDTYLDGDMAAALFETSTQRFQLETANKSDSSLNLNETITDDFQLLNDSVTDVEIDILKISDEIKFERKTALSKQQAQCLKKSHPIRRHYGSLFLQKMLDPKKLCELGTPKKYKHNELIELGVQSNVIDLNIDNVLEFKFDMWKFYSDDVCRRNVDGIVMPDEMCLIMDENSRVGVKELTSAFLSCPSVDPKLVPDHWIGNSLKWIMLKLASYERSYPHKFAGNGLTPENVLTQLKYRYGREIDDVKRSVIRRIVERDDSAAKRMVLFVSRILNNSSACTLELCDGWYSIRSNVLDSVLSHAVTTGKITIGTKLIIQGAEIIGFEEACSPLEMPISVALKITANSTRRARWYAKLGYCKEPWPFAISLNSVDGNGGLITRMRAYVLRIYPLIYAVKQQTENGQKTVFRSNKVEQRQNQKDDKKRLENVEKFYEEASIIIEKEYEEDRKASKRTKKKICDIDDGEELWNFMENSNDSIELDLSSTQHKLLEDYQTKRNDEMQNKISAIVREKLDSIKNATKSTPLQKIRLIDPVSPCATKTVILSIWNADESHPTMRENTIIDVRYVTANGMRMKDVQLTTSGFTKIQQVQMSPSSTSHEPFKRKLFSLAEVNSQQFEPYFNEVDTFGVVVKIEAVAPNYPFQLVYIADANKNMLCLKFWTNIQHHACDDIVQVNRCLMISQLEWRPIENAHRRTRNGIPHAFVTELTTFLVSPKVAERSLKLANLREEIDKIDPNQYVEECCEKLKEYDQGNKENSISNISSKTLDTSLNRTTIAESPVGRNSSVLLEKINRLQSYGTPPPIRKSYICAKPTPESLRKPFKTPSRLE
ncbi:uncharacterized protein LOC116344750 [Contarinia nasturtii]|uniref:uncharacterized protein LOC116344750 n=1 Tax=Contarinia nasturtii TaxID=265458 RepID=UPI0012D3FA38|nr:uncharacterized protein LOC116344750 [Contarinia nasturtii]